MAFATSLAERVDDLRFQSPMDEPAMLAYPSLRGNGGARMPHPSPQASDPRATLQRRFTTESAKLPSIGIIGTIGQQRAQLAEPLDLSSSTLHKVQLLEKKRQEYEMLKEQRRRFAAEMKLIDLQQRRGEQEILEMAESLGRVNSAGHQSEPTTPPEYTDSGFPTVLSRPNRYSTSSLISPPTFGARAARSASQITSPPSEGVWVCS
ncbi:MAG: hypothetical protein M1829_004077 [Trizodia sp. TS-e1964]|nr:MAG: hypothetical protein M1829_004077 [Trizodia sp. TS-e1964]